MIKRRNGRHWPAEGRPSVYAIRHRLRNELRPTGRFLGRMEIHERNGVECLVFNNVKMATPGPGTGDTKIGMLTIAMPSGAGGAQ
ncbi:hypothetical protein I5J49_gp48 [Mycobacterium phage ThulaThula]|uniref:Uncharacterized protein n=1 Tax=Mycobacterium phage ThulaThula TaxID=2599880 RepID=A0A5J6TE92_9CAUD|nr:hypothetical protein I5J49_gp48 [Mycobacterium phage ThulaThula]QFG09076.1 hypothetical protein PBI_THULATHULA_48 [Mycobacterium phage ThulaThula]